MEVETLSVNYCSAEGREIPAVSEVSFTIDAGEVVGLLGESGCGKTTTALALMRLLPASARLAGGRIRFQGTELLKIPERELTKFRGAQIALIFQEPAFALSPLLSIGDQIAEVLHAHRTWKWASCREEAKGLLELVHLPSPDSVYGAFPHELSGGQRRRVLIAQALACRPALIVADEPTSGLDSWTQAEILDLLLELKREFQTSMLFISHHPGVLARVADRLLVMYSGRIVEQGGLKETYGDPLHPYTRGLLRCMPASYEARSDAPKKHLFTLAGSPPDANYPGNGCRFAPRCSERIDVCDEREPPETQMPDRRQVRCYIYGN